jgi:heterodisulfide reductase subunit A2
LNIELMTLSEVVKVDGAMGDFTVTVQQNPRYIDMEKCIACGLCAEKCPKKVPSEFDQGMGNRKSAYILYGQAVPLKYAIDADTCIYFKNGKCKACEKFCPTGAVNFEDTVKTVEVNVGAVVLTPGFKPFDPSIFDYYNYQQLPDVVTSLEYERLLSASGPCVGHLVRPSDQTEPKKIAWLQCVGSRGINKCDNGFCSSVCCMYAIKQAIVTKEHTTGDVSQTIFYMDIRSHGKEFEKYYMDAEKKGIRFLRSRPHTFIPGKDGKGVKLEYVDEAGNLFIEEFDMMVMSIGLEAPASSKDLAAKLGIELDKYNFAKCSSFDPVQASKDGVYVAGCFQAPKDIPQSVVEASSAAAKASIALAEAKGTLAKTKTYPAEQDVTGQEPKVGVFVCSCGINIAGVVDVNAVAEYAKELPNVAYVENNMFTCSADTQVLIAEKIKEHGLNRVVIAACTPRTHEPLFKDTLKEAGLNEYLVEMANIRNQNSWVHANDPAKATSKAKDQVRMAVSKVSLLSPLEDLTLDVVQKALVVGGGISGMIAALGLGDQGYETVLLEKSERLGGNAWNLNTTWKGEEIRPQLEAMIQKVENHPKVTVYKKAELKTCVGSVGNFVSDVSVDGQTKVVKYGAAVVCTGGKEYKPTEYMHGEDQRVYSHSEFDAAMRKDSAELAKSGSVVFIQCVGSREPDRPYCSRVCCTHSVESALKLKKLNPDMNIYVLNRDIRTYGVREDLYTEARKQGVIFVRYELEKKPQVSKQGDDLIVEIEDHILHRTLKIKADRLVLASAIIPNESKNLVELYKCATNSEGFLTEAHPKLRPVDMSVDGLFLAGLCHYPKPIDEAIAQAQAAVSRAGVILAKSVMPLDSIKSMVTDKCDGCALCVDTCPYFAIKLVDYTDEDGREHKRIETDKALCKGCGICMATCPKGGVNVMGFTYNQIKAQIYSALQSA